MAPTVVTGCNWSTTVTPLRVTPDIIMIYPLTYLRPTVIHSYSVAAGIVDTKREHIGIGHRRRGIADSAGCAYDLSRDAGKHQYVATACIVPGILISYCWHVGVGHTDRGIVDYDTVGYVAVDP